MLVTIDVIYSQQVCASYSGLELVTRFLLVTAGLGYLQRAWISYNSRPGLITGFVLVTVGLVSESKPLLVTWRLVQSQRSCASYSGLELVTGFLLVTAGLGYLQRAWTSYNSRPVLITACLG